MGSIPVSIYSASGISAILGLNPYSTRLEAWQRVMEKLRPGFNAEKGYVLPEFPDNAPIRWGHAFEDAIIKLAEEKEGSAIVNREKSFQKKFGDIELTCHIDGSYQVMSELGATLHEGKTTNTRAFYSIKGEDYDDETGEIEFKRRWGEPGSDQVPEEYQVQCAVQRICTGAELVKLSVLVFPKSTQDFEELGWRIYKDSEKGYLILRDSDNKASTVDRWAAVFSEMGNFHCYNLPTNKDLESAIITAVQEFDAKYVKTELPPEFENYDDFKRLMASPMGTLIATPEIIAKAKNYAEAIRQLGKQGPVYKNKEILKVELSNWMTKTAKSDWSSPPDKLVIVDPSGGNVLISYSKKGGFRAGKV